jgi:hypothetical protein
VCTACDRGQIYCSRRCSSIRRRKSVREAGRRYQKSPLGARNHARRQERYRARRRGKVTHQGSAVARPEAQRPLQVAREAGAHGEETVHEESRPERESFPRCVFCGRRLGPFVRLGSLSSRARRGSP